MDYGNLTMKQKLTQMTPEEGAQADKNQAAFQDEFRAMVREQYKLPPLKPPKVKPVQSLPSLQKLGRSPKPPNQ